MLLKIERSNKCLLRPDISIVERIFPREGPQALPGHQSAKCLPEVVEAWSHSAGVTRACQTSSRPITRSASRVEKAAVSARGGAGGGGGE